MKNFDLFVLVAWPLWLPFPAAPDFHYRQSNLSCPDKMVRAFPCLLRSFTSRSLAFHFPQLDLSLKNLNFNMSEPLGDSEFHSVPLSDTSNDSIQRSPTQEQTPFIRPTETTRPATTARPFPTTSRSSTSDEPFLFIPEEDQFLIPRPGTTDEPISTNQPASSAEPASSIGPSDSSPPKIPTYIHPVSEGGSVTWKDHSELVYHKGKDRGPRTPAPTLQPGYKSKGPLRDTFDFDKLRTSRVRVILLWSCSCLIRYLELTSATG